MQVILRTEVPSLGREGDIVKVAGGYGNNYLIPKGMAVIATPGNLKQLKQRRAVIAKREAVVRAEAQEQAAKLEGKSVTIPAKAGAEGRLYGSITMKDIAAAIEESLGVAVDKRRIEPSDPIKQAGDVMVRIKLYPEVEASVEIKVVPELVEGEASEAQAAEIKTTAEAAAAPAQEETAEVESTEAEKADEDEA